MGEINMYIFWSGGNIAGRFML